MNLDVKLSPASQQAIEALGRYPEILEPALKKAMDLSMSYMMYETVHLTDALFKNPTGRFNDSLHQQVDSPYQAQLWSDAPYGQRLHFGYSGYTDALGRDYIEWPAGRYSLTGYRWATRAIDSSKSSIKYFFETNITEAHDALGGMTE